MYSVHHNGTDCGSDEFECQPGECISEDLLYDGTKDYEIQTQYKK